MFCAVAVAQAGFFLALPSLFSLLCLAVGLWALSRQAKAEEEHLSQVFAEEYRQYTRDVPRWV